MDRQDYLEWLEYINQKESERAYDELSEEQKLKLLEYTKGK